MPDKQSAGEQRRVFKINRCLGRGGFGEVYKAMMITSGGVQTDVAIKVLHAGLDPRSQAVQRLRDEGKLMGVLRHPSILKCYDLSIIHGRIALVTEYVEGDDLDGCFGVIDPIPLKALLQVTARVAEALKAAWTTPAPGTEEPLHLIHRDVKPANIRISVHGEVKLLDFGIARAQHVDREAKTQTHTVIGSFPYMSPERFLQEDVGAPSDVYALGCVLYEGIAGDRVFRDVKLKQMYLLACDEDDYAERVEERIAELPAYTPPEVVELIRAMLAFEPEQRPSADEVGRRCDDLADDADGYGLRRWTRDREWPEYQPMDGELDGTIITEGPVETAVRAPDSAVATTGGSAKTFIERPADVADSVASVEIPGPLPPAVSSDTMTVPAMVGSTQPLPQQRRGIPWFKLTIAMVAVLILVVFVIGGGLGGALVALEYLGDPDVAVASDPEPATDPVPEADPVDPAPDDPAPEDGVADADATPDPDPVVDPAPAPPTPAPVRDPIVRPEPEPDPVKVVVVAPLPEPAPAEPPPEPAPAEPVYEPVAEPTNVGAPGQGWGDPDGTPAAPKTSAQKGTLAVEGSVLVELRKGGLKNRAGYVPTGNWQVFADFGSGLQSTGQTLSVLAGGKYTISCSKLRRQCVVP